MFSVVDWSLATVRDWASRAGHEIALLVAVTGSGSVAALRGSDALGGETVVMVVPDVAACAATLAEMRVDLGIVFSFPRIPDEIASLPRHGMLNLHPSLLPAYRGPNGFRALYEGETRLGATLHHLTPELDGGPILAQASHPTPDDVQPMTALETLQRAARDALEDGVPRALAGEAGQAQDPSVASDARPFTQDESVLDLALSAFLFQCRTSALVLAGVQPSVVFGRERRALRTARDLPGLTAAAPGVIRLSARRAIVATADGVLELELGDLPF